jgi:hypothetical protein
MSLWERVQRWSGQLVEFSKLNGVPQGSRQKGLHSLRSTVELGNQWYLRTQLKIDD